MSTEALGGAQARSLAGTSPDAGTVPSIEEWNKMIRKVPVPKAGCFKAEHPSTAWVEVPCVTPPDEPHVPKHAVVSGGAENVGNGNDYAIQAPTNTTIALAEGSFPSVSGVTAESDFTPNNYSLQLNSNQFPGTTTSQLANLCNQGSNQGSTASSCNGWEQFVYDNSQSVGFIQYWLLNYNKPGSTNACPTGPAPLGQWRSYGLSCFINNPTAVTVTAGPEPITNLANLQLQGGAGSTSDQLAVLVGGPTAFSFSTTTSVLGLSQKWGQAEFNIFGNSGGTEACFNSGSSINVQTFIETTPGTNTGATCVPWAGTTGEYNNLTLGTCTPSGDLISFTQNNAQTCVPGWGTFWPVSFQANTNSLFITYYNAAGSLIDIDEGLGMMAGTVPSLVTMAPPSINLAIAFQANTGHLYLDETDPSGHFITNPTDQQEVMQAGTSPSIALTSSGSPIIAYHGSNGDLFLEASGPGSGQETFLGMAQGTSPSVGVMTNGNIVAAFQAAGSGHLYIYENGGNRDLGLGMWPGTSPSLAINPSGGYDIVFQAAGSGYLWLVGVPSSVFNGFNYTDEGLGMQAGTSPSVTFIGSTPQWAFQANTGNLWVGVADQHLPMNHAASPTIMQLYGAGYQVAYEASDGNLAFDINGTLHDTGLGMNTP